MNTEALLWAIGFFAMAGLALWSNLSWSVFVDKVNKDWFDTAMRQNEGWAELCEKIDKERKELKARVEKLEEHAHD